MNGIADQVANILVEIRTRRPLVHNITNYVVMNSTANILLSLGASPVMAHAIEEVEEMVGLANALVLNIGTLSKHWIDSMIAAGKAARARSIPIVLDPVGAGATRYRTETALRLLAEVPPTVIRGNASEVLSLATPGAETKGVDSTRGVVEAESTAATIARRHSCVVAVTGPEDFITDGRRVMRVANGHPLLTRVTGTGCAATAVIAACCGVHSDALVATAAGLAIFGIAAEIAAEGAPGPGHFAVQLFDSLATVDATTVRLMTRAREERLLA